MTESSRRSKFALSSTNDVLRDEHRGTTLKKLTYTILYRFYLIFKSYYSSNLFQINIKLLIFLIVVNYFIRNLTSKLLTPFSMGLGKPLTTHN